MSYQIIISEFAEYDIENAYDWYELNLEGLGHQFYDSINNSISFIALNPFACVEMIKGVRRMVMRRFPYGIYYKVDIISQEIQIIGVVHFKRSLNIIQNRI